MNFKILFTPPFERELKKLSKKHTSIRNDLSILIELLICDALIGKPLGNNCYKIRMTITSKNKGKSGGARVITCVKIVEETIYLLSIYDKADTDNISDSELLNRIKEV